LSNVQVYFTYFTCIINTQYISIARQRRMSMQSANADHQAINTAYRTLLFWRKGTWWNSNWVTPTGAPNAGGVWKIGDFRPVSRNISETVQDKDIVTIER